MNVLAFFIVLFFLIIFTMCLFKTRFNDKICNAQKIKKTWKQPRLPLSFTSHCLVWFTNGVNGSLGCMPSTRAIYLHVTDACANGIDQYSHRHHNASLNPGLVPCLLIQRSYADIGFYSYASINILLMSCRGREESNIDRDEMKINDTCLWINWMSLMMNFCP